MDNSSTYKSIENRANKVCEIALQHYEAGRQDRCFLYVYRNYIYPKFGISYRTYLRYLKKNGISAKNFNNK